MSTPTAEPTMQDTSGDVDELLHFGCVLHRLAARTSGAPVRCLCGKVQTASTPARGDGTELRCVVCLDLAPTHIGSCAACRQRVKA